MNVFVHKEYVHLPLPVPYLQFTTMQPEMNISEICNLGASLLLVVAVLGLMMLSTIFQSYQYARLSHYIVPGGSFFKGVIGKGP